MPFKWVIRILYYKTKQKKDPLLSDLTRGRGFGAYPLPHFRMKNTGGCQEHSLWETNFLDGEGRVRQSAPPSRELWPPGAAVPRRSLFLKAIHTLGTPLSFTWSSPLLWRYFISYCQIVFLCFSLSYQKTLKDWFHRFYFFLDDMKCEISF